MRKSWWVAVLSFAFLLAAVSMVSAGSTIDKIMKKQELVIGTASDMPPLTFKTKDGKLEGLDIDLGQIIASTMGVRFKAVDIPFEELIPALENGKIDMILSCMTMTPQRNLRVAYVGPYFMSGQSLLTTQQTAASVKGLHDMNSPGFSIAVPSGTTSESFTRNQLPKARVLAVKTTDDALGLLLKGKVSGVIADYPFCVVAAFRYRDKGIVSRPPLTTEPIGLAIRADDLLFMNMLQNFVAMLQVSGQLQSMAKRWFENPWWIKMISEDRQVL